MGYWNAGTVSDEAADRAYDDYKDDFEPGVNMDD